MLFPQDTKDNQMHKCSILYSLEHYFYQKVNMTEHIFNSKRHIVNLKALEDYECCICYQLTQNMMVCKGPCAKPYCLKCEGRIKYQKNVCPSKCSTPFHTQKINSFKLQYKLQYQCPYDPQNCKAFLTSVQVFHQHCVSCPFKTAQGRKEQICRKQFLCNSGHKLQLVTDSILKSLDKNQIQNFYTLVMNDLCVGCGARNLCRSICVPCSKQTRHVYCVDCRKYPFTRTKCPLGHQFTKSAVQNNYGCVCDGCGISGSLLSNIGYSEYICDIFLCQQCYNHYPEYVQKLQKQKIKQEVQQPQIKLEFQPKYQPDWE